MRPARTHQWLILRAPHLQPQPPSALQHPAEVPRESVASAASVQWERSDWPLLIPATNACATVPKYELTGNTSYQHNIRCYFIGWWDCWGSDKHCKRDQDTVWMWRANNLLLNWVTNTCQHTHSLTHDDHG